MTAPTRIPWRRVLLEGVVIVGSILLAFGIDAWWDGKQEREREVEILSSLLEEFGTNRSSLASTVASHEQAVSAVHEVLSAIDSIGVGRTVSLPDSTLFDALVYSSFDPVSGALNAVLQSGDLQLVQDRALRQRLAEWPTRVADATENAVHLRSIVGPRLLEVLSTDVSLARVFGALPGYSDEVAASTAGHTSIRSSTLAASLLADAWGWLSEAVREESRLASRADSLTTLINQALENGR